MRFQMAAAPGQFGSFEGRFAALCQPFRSLRAHSSPGLCQKRSTHHPQIGEREQRVCWRQFKFDHLCQLNFDQGSKAGFVVPGCG